MLEQQGEVCNTCGREPSPGRRLDIDHDHRTGEILGGLCHRCNRALGFVSGTPHQRATILNAMARHVQRHTGWFVPKKKRRKK